MPYQKIGFVRVPRSRYIPKYCAQILEAFGDTFDQDVAEAIRSLGHPRDLLKTFFFQRCLLLKSPKLDGNPDLRLAFLVVLIDFLGMTGYIQDSVTLVDYVIDPVRKADELLDLMIGTRMPKFESSEMSGEWATIATLECFFPEVIRRTAVIVNERKLMANRFRQWLGNIGFKLMTGSSRSLSQSERSFLVVYGSTKRRTKGDIIGLANTPIPPIENKDPLVIEIGALAEASSLAGPCTNHMRLVSNAILEQLVFYYGPHHSEVSTQVGYIENFGPFVTFNMTSGDNIPWLLESQITGLAAQSAIIAIRPDKQPPFTIRMPLPITFKTQTGALCQYPDSPEFNLYLTNQKDISRFTWDYPSRWQGRRISSLNDGGTMDLAIADAATQVKAAGGMQIESPVITTFGTCWFTEAAKSKIRQDELYFKEYFVLPGRNGLVFKGVDLTAHYAVMGKVEAISAFSEFLEVPMQWFMVPDESVMQFVATVEGLTLEEQVRFKSVIHLCHNAARYARITKKQPPIKVLELAKAMLNEPQSTTIEKVD